MVLAFTETVDKLYILYVYASTIYSYIGVIYIVLGRNNFPLVCLCMCPSVWNYLQQVKYSCNGNGEGAVVGP